VAPAQIEQQLRAYTGRNGAGYLSPLVEALGTDLNSSLFHTALIPTNGFHVGVELAITTVFFGEDTRTFMATTEGDFSPQQTKEAPTVVGPTGVVYVEGDAGTRFAFPGGFDVDNLPFAAPQLRIGSWRGTEVVFRLLIYDTGHDELGDLSVYGAGMRHNVSQYLGAGFPADVALGFVWQSVSLGNNQQGDDLIASDAYSVGLQASRGFGSFTPYAGLAFDWFSMDVAYEFSSDETIRLEFDEAADVHITLGFSYNLAFTDVYGEYNLANQNALSLGLAFQYTSSDRSVGP
jgi:hypothetical protein